MRLLKSAFINYANDYFGRMGGSGRYGRFMDWHPAGLVLMIATGVTPPDSHNFSLVHDGSIYLPSEIWRQTDTMPQQVYEKLKDVKIERSEFDEFIHFISEGLKKLHPNELKGFNSFLEENKPSFEKYFAHT
jgi:predicted CopG family antitoxin